MVSQPRIEVWTARLVIAALLVFCCAFPTSAAPETVIRVGGTGSALGVMKKLAEAYEKSHPNLRLQILPSLGSTAGIKALLGGSIDLALASRPLTDSEHRQGAVEAEYARSPFAIVTNSRVDKKDVTIRELEEYYSNPSASWPGGGRIRLILRPEQDIDTMLLRSLSAKMDQAVKAALGRPGMIVAITDQEAIAAVARTPGALGGGTLTEIISEQQPVHVLSLNGVKPDVKNIASKAYPLVKSFYLVTTSMSPIQARQFADFIRSPAARKILAETGNLIVEEKRVSPP